MTTDSIVSVAACGRLSLALGLAATPGPAAAADSGQHYVMKLGLATVNDSQHEW